MRKNIYIKDSDLPLFEWAENEVGDSLSSILAEALTLYKQRKEMEAKLAEQGYETIRWDIQSGDNFYVRTKQFEGKEIIPDFQSEDNGERYAVAVTKHGRIAIADIGADDAFSRMQVFNNLNAIKDHNRELYLNSDKTDYPEDLINAIAVELGEDHVEVLDI